MLESDASNVQNKEGESILPPPPDSGSEPFDLGSQPRYEKPTPDDGDEELVLASTVADSTPMPPASIIDKDPLSLIPKALSILRDPNNNIGDFDTAFLGLRSKLFGTGIDLPLNEEQSQQEILLLRLMNIFKHSPKEPEDGFEHAFQYGVYVKELNRVMAYFHALAAADPNRYRLRDPENPEQFRGHFYMECGDGRNSLVPFKNPARVLNVFDTEWLPSAGNIFFPQISVPKTSGDVDEMFNTNPTLKKEVFARMEFLYGKKLQQLLADYDSGELSTVWFEYQAHFDSEHFPHHGCGAHCSDLAAAQLETLKNCFLTEAWLKEMHSEYFKKGAFKVFRTCHDTGEGKPIYTARKIDNERLSGSEYAQKIAPHADAIGYAHEHFEAPHLAEPEEDIVRNYYGNPFEIEMAEHDEQTIKISNLHFASTLMGQSVLEISWTDDIETLYKHIKVLLSIIEKNFRNPETWGERYEEKKEAAKRAHKKAPIRTKIPPAILHFDLVKDNVAMLRVFERLKRKLLRDPELADRIDSGSLQLIATVTDPETYKLRLKI
jgi:hypothetical protein